MNTPPTNDKPITNAASLDNLSQQLLANDNPTTKPIPPLEKWQPDFCGMMDLTIKANGEWWHAGRKIERDAMVTLFSRVLWAEVDAAGAVTYFLKTPVEKLQIAVEDAPLLITQYDYVAQNDKRVLHLITAQGERVTVDAAHPLQFGLPFHLAQQHADADATNTKTCSEQAEQPYVKVRQNGDSAIWALVHRNVFYQLANEGELVEQGDGVTLRLPNGDTVIELSMPYDDRA